MCFATLLRSDGEEIRNSIEESIWGRTNVTPTGHALAPVLKVTANRETYARMSDNMDMNLSGIIDGSETIDAAGQRIFDEVHTVASGRTTKAERFGFSDIAVDHVCRFI